MPIEDYFTPGSREWYEAKLYGMGNGQASVGGNVNALAETALSMAPGSGEAMSARDAWQASGRGANALAQGQYGQAAGEYANMLAAAAGAIPGAGVIARGTKRGAAWMERNLPKGVNALADRMMPADPASTTFIFAGPTAKTADHAALSRAQNMAKAGASRDDIWSQTGWFAGPDGKWRFEIDDSGAKLSGEKPMTDAFGYLTGTEGAPVTQFTGLEHPNLGAAYDDILPSRFQGYYGDNVSLEGAYNNSTRGMEVSGPTADAVRGVTLHELQHSVQDAERFAPGTNWQYHYAKGDLPLTVEEDTAVRRLTKMLDGESPGTPAHRQLMDEREKIKQDAAFRIYQRTAGEVEARNVQSRMNMNALERRARAPWLTQDVPDNQQIFSRP